MGGEESGGIATEFNRQTGRHRDWQGERRGRVLKKDRGEGGDLQFTK